MRKLHMLLVMLAGLFAAAIAPAQDASDARTQEAAATQGLSILRSLASEKSRDLGFASEAEVARAKLAPPMAVFNVDLSALKEFRAGGDASAYIKPSPARFIQSRSKAPCAVAYASKGRARMGTDPSRQRRTCDRGGPRETCLREPDYPLRRSFRCSR